MIVILHHHFRHLFPIIFQNSTFPPSHISQKQCSCIMLWLLKVFLQTCDPRLSSLNQMRSCFCLYCEYLVCYNFAQGSSLWETQFHQILAPKISLFFLKSLILGPPWPLSLQTISLLIKSHFFLIRVPPHINFKWMFLNSLSTTFGVAIIENK